MYNKKLTLARQILETVLLPIIILNASLVLNRDNFHISSMQGSFHIIVQTFFIYGLICIFQKNKLIRFLIALIVVIELFTQLSYGSSVSISIVMSILSASNSEILSFVQFNYSPVLLTILFFWGMVFFKLPSGKIFNRFGIMGSLIGISYITIPTMISAKSLLSSQDYGVFYQSGLARGQSKYTTIGEYLARDMSLRFPPIRSIRGINDSFRFMLLQFSSESTWTNVTTGDLAPKLLVIGIGESLRAGNMGIYGYERDTTPRLLANAENLNIYQDAFAAGTNTWTSIPASLTKFSGHPDLSKSIINLAKDAGYTTYWLSNQAKLSEWDFAISAIAEQSDYIYFTSNEQAGTLYDDVLLAKLKEILMHSKSGKKQLVILHNYGSHMEFKDRYPAEFARFKGNDIQLNQYDNSILYTDYLQSETLKLVSEHGGKYLFFADHGLINPKDTLALKHDVRYEPDMDSIKVPFFSSLEKMITLKKENPISLFYFECIFSQWSGINAAELRRDDYCKKALNKKSVDFIDSNLKLHKNYFKS